MAEAVKAEPMQENEHCHGHRPLRTGHGLAAETGLRAGELCGPTVDDIDLERGMLQVRQSAWRGKLGDQDG